MVSINSVGTPKRNDDLMHRLMNPTPTPKTKKKQEEEEKKRVQKAIEREIKKQEQGIPPNFLIPPRRLQFGQEQSGSGKRKRKSMKRKGKKKRKTKKRKGKKKKRSVKK